ncbi:sulfate ABC transporter permease subunit CysT [Lichenihabitans sp. Uapishka_5]|uniref:sulfate ABC transporter permease subunit CysT n=1 Tax=Lichenihabitans sp. Uapishka_5 TaxID=3037302 RepID=UPI0029E823BC|nr:sulfate ABC transporter permease subunit CysT [Lichenihabitans sp. Uapishka_5]MDX7952918.1 sulfate ABC transporter permease subunit CysT [Lichenihabitans sp. Uapishka_5]
MTAVRHRRVIPGFGLTLGTTLVVLSAVVLLPLAALVVRSAQLTGPEFWATVTDPVVVAAYRLTFGAAAIAALCNAVLGLMVAWTLVRYRFPGRRLFDALIDFPFALPTAVAGLTFSSLYLKDGWIGGFGDRVTTGLNGLAGLVGHPGLLPPDALSALDFAYTNTPTGIVIVLIFVGLPFVVRSVQPVLQAWDAEYELAAESLGAGPFTTFRRVIFPEIFPAWLSGASLAFARAVGEYGSVIFIAGNIPGKSQIAPLLIVQKLDDFQYPQATAIGIVLLGASLAILLVMNGVEAFVRRARSV